MGGGVPVAMSKDVVVFHPQLLYRIVPLQVTAGALWLVLICTVLHCTLVARNAAIASHMESMFVVS